MCPTGLKVFYLRFLGEKQKQGRYEIEDAAAVGAGWIAQRSVAHYDDGAVGGTQCPGLVVMP